MKITFGEAKEAGIKKWTYFVEHSEWSWGTKYKALIIMIKEFPQLRQYTAACGFCSLFKSNYCIGCPIFIKDNCCIKRFSLYSKWYHSWFPWTAKKYARKILTIIQESKEPNEKKS